MPKRRTPDVVQCQHFRWRLFRRKDVWQADGRGRERDVGRHSLNTKDRAEALENLPKLDLTIAVQLGLAEPKTLPCSSHPLSLQAGRALYEDHLNRPDVIGGPSAKTRARYRAVLDKFRNSLDKSGINRWNAVNEAHVSAYLRGLQRQGYADATLYLEAVTILQVLKFLVGQEHIRRECLFHLKLKKPDGTSSYCYRGEEVAAMISVCQEDPSLGWMADVIQALYQTGMRIGELATLRHSDLDFERNLIRLTNDRGRRALTRSDRRVTKNRRDRCFPMTVDLRAVLQRQARTQDGFVFHGPRGGRLKPDTVRNIFVAKVIAPLVDRFPSSDGEIGFADGRLHSFRHAFCSRCANDGVPERVVMSWLGHSSSKVTNIYYHLSDREGQRQIKKVDFTGGAGGGVAVGMSPDHPEPPQDGQADCVES